jgi:hypothetical protein
MAPWFRSKFEPFRSVRPLRGVLGQRTRSIHLTRIMDRGGLVLANLSKGLLGEYNARLLGFVVFARLWAATLTRITRPQGPRQPCFVYLDEAGTITTWSLPAILSKARKYGVGATLANQYFDQIPVALHESVLANVGTTIAFRTGAKDAAAFASHYDPEVQPESLRRLPHYKAVAEVGASRGRHRRRVRRSPRGAAGARRLGSSAADLFSTHGFRLTDISPNATRVAPLATYVDGGRIPSVRIFVSS